MSRICELTGKKAISGNNVSFSKRKTRRKFNPNLQVKRFFNPETGEWVKLKVSTAALRTINKKGIATVLREYKKNGKIK
ncbi:MAG: 50S ribosomal protein L28 [Bacteroidia bacterium]|nr:50S ribosomal protein L28 [Bacteroidia bacterium]